MASKNETLKSSDTDALTGDRSVTLKNESGEHVIDDQGDHVLQGTQQGQDANQQVNISKNMQLSNALQRGVHTLSDTEANLLQDVKDKALELRSLMTSAGASQEIQLAERKIREAVMWFHNHMTTDTRDLPKFQPDAKI